MHKKQSMSLHRLYFNSILITTLAGIVTSAYLAYLHYRTYTDSAYSSFCAISKSINCDTVAQSPWSVIGEIPISVWGFWGYLFFLLALCPLKNRGDSTYSQWAPLIATGGIYALISLFFAYISTFKIHAYCILCICIYVINFFLFYISFLAKRRFSNKSFIQDFIISIQHLLKNRKYFAGAGAIVLLIIATKLYLPQYWKFEPPVLSTDIPMGITESGHPWIGAENPTLTIEEYFDYQCFQCAKTHFLLRRLLEKNPSTIRLVHRHYPMDHEFNPTVIQEPFHIGSGKMALLAVYAMTQNKFWQMNDALFQLARSKQSFNTKFLAEKTGIPSSELAGALSNPEIRQHLNLDIWQGMKLRITGTPSFVIEGKVFQGTLPADLLNKIQQ